MEKIRTVEEVWDYLIDSELFTYEELQLITNMYGYTLEVLNLAIYSRYGYNDINQLIDVE